MSSIDATEYASGEMTPEKRVSTNLGCHKCPVDNDAGWQGWTSWRHYLSDDIHFFERKLSTLMGDVLEGAISSIFAF